MHCITDYLYSQKYEYYINLNIDFNRLKDLAHLNLHCAVFLKSSDDKIYGFRCEFWIFAIKYISGIRGIFLRTRVILCWNWGSFKTRVMWISVLRVATFVISIKEYKLEFTADWVVCKKD